MNSRQEIENYESPRSIEPLSQRELMLDIGAALWLLLALQAMLAGSLVDEPMSTAAWTARLVIAGYATATAMSMLTWVRRLDDDRTYLMMNITVAAVTVVQLALSTYGPGMVAIMYVAYTSTAIFVGQFLTLREISLQLAWLTLFSGLGVVVHYGDPEVPMMLARIVALVPIYWAVALSVYALRTDRAKAISEVEEYTFGDPLTGLVNLRALRQRGDGLLAARNERINRPTALLVIDLDGFRAANVLRGHLGGDRLLCDIAAGIRSIAESHHTLARTGSDEFMVLIENAETERLDEIAQLYRRAVIAASVTDDDSLPPVDASIGKAISPGDGRSFDDLLAVADRDMYRVKLKHEKQAPAGGAIKPRADDLRLGTRSLGSGQKHSPPTSRFAWKSRPMQVRYVTSTWVLTTTIVLISLTMPDAVVDNWGAVLTLSLFAYLLTGIRYFSPPSTKAWQQVVDVLVALGALVLMTYWTGGAGSPAWPAGLLILVYVGWFMSLKWIFPMAIVGVLAILLPFVYEDVSVMPLLEIVALIGGACLGALLATLMFYNHFYLERARELSATLESIDPRTGVHNRREFERRLTTEIDALSYGDIDALAIVMIDLGDFKAVTASIGRGGADNLLTQVGDVLTGASRGEDCVARLGGDQFAVILPGVTADTARALAQRFVRAVTERVEETVQPAGANLVPSAGFALYGMHGRTKEELITAADVALTAAKTTGRSEERVSSFVVAL